MVGHERYEMFSSIAEKKVKYSQSDFNFVHHTKPVVQLLQTEINFFLLKREVISAKAKIIHDQDETVKRF